MTTTMATTTTTIPTTTDAAPAAASSTAMTTAATATATATAAATVTATTTTTTTAAAAAATSSLQLPADRLVALLHAVRQRDQAQLRGTVTLHRQRLPWPYLVSLLRACKSYSATAERDNYGNDNVDDNDNDNDNDNSNSDAAAMTTLTTTMQRPLPVLYKIKWTKLQVGCWVPQYQYQYQYQSQLPLQHQQQQQLKNHHQPERRARRNQYHNHQNSNSHHHQDDDDTQGDERDESNSSDSFSEQEDEQQQQAVSKRNDFKTLSSSAAAAATDLDENDEDPNENAVIALSSSSSTTTQRTRDDSTTTFITTALPPLTMAHALADALHHSPALVELNLSHSRNLWYLLQPSTTTTTLDASSDDSDISGDMNNNDPNCGAAMLGMHALASAVASCRTLYRLFLTGTGLNDAQVHILCQHLIAAATNATTEGGLTKLHLGHNSALTASAMESIAALLVANNEHVNSDNNNNRCQHHYHNRRRALVKLDLRFVPAVCTGMSFLTQALTSPDCTLQVLSLRSCSLTDSVLHTFIHHGLRQNQHIQKLDLRGNWELKGSLPAASVVVVGGDIDIPVPATAARTGNNKINSNPALCSAASLHELIQLVQHDNHTLQQIVIQSPSSANQSNNADSIMLDLLDEWLHVNHHGPELARRTKQLWHTLQQGGTEAVTRLTLLSSSFRSTSTKTTSNTTTTVPLLPGGCHSHYRRHSVGIGDNGNINNNVVVIDNSSNTNMDAEHNTVPYCVICCDEFVMCPRDEDNDHDHDPNRRNAVQRFMPNEPNVDIDACLLGGLPSGSIMSQERDCHLNHNNSTNNRVTTKPLSSSYATARMKQQYQQQQQRRPVMLLPCQHNNCCWECSQKLQQCHMCRCAIVKVWNSQMHRKST